MLLNHSLKDHQNKGNAFQVKKLWSSNEFYLSVLKETYRVSIENMGTDVSVWRVNLSQLYLTMVNPSGITSYEYKYTYQH